MSEIKVLIAEDHEMFRVAICRHLYDHNIQVIGEASNGKELIELMKSNEPDIVLLDIIMEGMDGSEALDYIVANYPLQKVIMLSMYDDEILIQNFLRRGAAAYVKKFESIERLVDVIHSTMYCVMDSIRHEKYFLTKREMEILPYLCDGYTNDEIARELNIVPKTVEAHRYRLFSKLGAKKLCDFLKTAFHKGFQFLR